MGKKSNTTFLTVSEVAFFSLLALRSFSEFFSHTLGWSVFVGPIDLNPSVGIMLLLNAVGGGYLFFLWRRGKPILNRLGLFFLVWVLSLAPWVYHAAVRGGLEGLVGVREWIRLFSLIVVYLTALAIVRRREVHWVLHACLWALPIPLVFTYYQIIMTWLAPERGLSRVFGSAFHPNGLAFFLVVMIALVTWKFSQPVLSIKQRLFWGFLWVIQFVALLTTISGNSWLALSVFLLLFALLSRNWKLRVTAGGVLAASLLVFALAYWGFFSLKSFDIQKEIAQDLAAIGLQDSGIGGGSLAGRFVMWGQLLELWQQEPLLGYGLDRTRFVNPLFKYAHNDYVRYLVEGGVFGFLAYLMFLGAVGYELWRVRRTTVSTEGGLLLALGIGLFAAWVVGSFSEDLISFTSFQVYLWTVLAAASSPSKLGPGRSRQRTPVRDLAFQLPRPLKKLWGYRLAIRPELTRVPCPHCDRSLPTLGLICSACSRWTLSKLPLSSLMGGVLLAVMLIGFYLWNQGSGIETFFWGWVLWYALLAVWFRHHEHYVFLLLGTILLGAITLPLWYPTAGRDLQILSRWAWAALLLLILIHWLISWWRTVFSLQKSRVQSLPALLLGLGGSVEGLYRIGSLLQDQNRILTFSQVFPGAFAFWTSAPFLLTFIAVLLIAILDRARTLQNIRTVFHATMTLIGETVLVTGLALFRALRTGWLPLLALAAVSWIVHLALQNVDAFIYGTPWALGYLTLMIGALFLLLVVLHWSQSSIERSDWLPLGVNFGIYGGMIQVGAWMATGILWTTAKLLPQFGETRRFVPLLLERPVGTYTWISLGGASFLLLLLAARKATHRLSKGHTTRLHSHLSER